MELLAVIVALELLKTASVLLQCTPIPSIADASKKWVFNWEKKNFKDKKKCRLMAPLFRNISQAPGAVSMD